MSCELGGCELNECGAEVVVFVYSSNVAISIASRALAIATQGKFVLIFFFVVCRCVCALPLVAFLAVLPLGRFTVHIRWSSSSSTIIAYAAQAFSKYEREKL